jgi:NAD(P)-dependent dehydrogenase (short-subunit alcohol dehydrogenase family)
MRVVLTSQASDRLEDTIDESGVAPERALAVTADLADPAAAAHVVAAARAAFGRVDVLINNAALMPDQLWPDYMDVGEPLPWTVDPALYARFLAVNVQTPHALATLVLPEMIERGWGRIINITTSLDTMLKLWPYGSTKAALEAYTANLARALENTGVTANAFLPGGLTKAEPIRDARGKVVREVLSPKVMEKPLLWLVSDASNGFNGRRFLAAKWDLSQPDAEACQAAAAPAGWSGHGQIVPKLADSN